MLQRMEDTGPFCHLLSILLNTNVKQNTHLIYMDEFFPSSVVDMFPLMYMSMCSSFRNKEIYLGCILVMMIKNASK